MAQAERITKRKVSSYNDGDPHFGIGGADLKELGLEPGDQVKVITKNNQIIVEPLKDDDAE